jgi:hypothetical protein
MRTSTRSTRSIARALALVAIGLVIAACGSSATGSSARPTATSPASTGGSSMPGMNMNMEAVPGDGLLTSYAGFRLQPLTASVPAGQASTYRFRILGADGVPVTRYQVEQTKLLHFYLVRSDITGFEHLHPTLGSDGTWSVTVTPAAAGSYRVYTQFDADPAGTVTSLVLSQPLSVTGTPSADQTLPAASSTASVDGYDLSLSGTPKAGTTSPLSISFRRDGQPVTDLQPYLDTYAHLTAIHQGTLGFAHLHPSGAVDGDHGGPTLHFMTDFAQAGDYRLFIQFQTGGVLHTAAVTLAVGA